MIAALNEALLHCCCEADRNDCPITGQSSDNTLFRIRHLEANSSVVVEATDQSLAESRLLFSGYNLPPRTPPSAVLIHTKKTVRKYMPSENYSTDVQKSRR